ncbi:MAG: type VI secretion system baseplate subunit TssF, partial [Planctomycetota bacterium]
SSEDLHRNVDRETFQLGCTPLVNLFEKRAEPIALDRQRYEYRVVPDARRPRSHEVFSIDRIVATSPTDEEIEFRPLFSVRHGGDANRRGAYWQASRRPSTSTAEGVQQGSEVFVSLCDLSAAPAEVDQWIADVRITCLNRDLPNQLPFGGGQPFLQIAGGAAAKIDCLTPPTKTRRPPLDDALLWRLVSALSLNHLSLVDGADGGGALREVLTLYDLAGTDQTRTMIEGLAGVDSRRVVGRAGGAAAGGFCRGVEVTIKLDEERFSGGGLFLLATVIDRFLGMYATINSFTRTRVVTVPSEATIRLWPPRAGEQPLA